MSLDISIVKRLHNSGYGSGSLGWSLSLGWKIWKKTPLSWIMTISDVISLVGHNTDRKMIFNDITKNDIQFPFSGDLVTKISTWNHVLYI